MTGKGKLIKKLYEGTCSPKELRLLFDLLQEEDSTQDKPKVMEKLWEELSTYPDLEESIASEMMTELFDRVEKQESKAAGKVMPQKRRPASGRRRRFLQLASAAMFVLLLGTVFWLWLRPVEQVVVQTAYAEQKTIQLPDHTTVKLNANSTLSYPKSWDPAKPRQVRLRGEAYFEVEKKPLTGQKFQVITEDLTIEVLGTTFNVNARQAATKVFLEEGLINLDLEEQSEDILMEPGEMVTYSKSQGKPLKKQIEKETPASWKDGTAVLRDVLLSEIIQKVHEIYDVRIVLEDESYLNREFTVFLPVEDPDMGYKMLVGLGLDMEKGIKRWTVKQNRE